MIIFRLAVICIFLGILAATYTTGIGVVDLLTTGNQNNPCTPEAASLLSSIMNDPFGSVDQNTALSQLVSTSAAARGCY